MTIGPGTSIVRTSNGNYYTSASVGSVVLEWGPDGKPIRAFGKAVRGRGDNEQTANTLMVFHDSLLFGNRVMSIYDTMGKYQRDRSVTAPLTTIGATQILDNGNVLVSSISPRTSGNYFSIIDERDSVVSKFDPMNRYDSTALKRLASTRYIAYGGGNTFWAGPRPGPPDGMKLEQWTTDGRRLDSMQFQLPWFPPQRGKSADIGYRIITVHQDSSGAILVIAFSKNARYKSFFDTGKFPTDDMYDHHYILVDPSSKRIIAEGVPDPATPLPSGFFDGSRTGYTLASNPGDQMAYDIISYSVVDEKSGQPTTVCR